MGVSNIDWMRCALKLAHRAAEQGEVPVGAVIVQKGEIIGEGWNQPIALHDPTAHAEIQALRAAASFQKNYRLPNATLYCTLEPCVMCAGAMMHARIERLIFGAYDIRYGAAVSQFGLLNTPTLNHHVAWEAGVLQEECTSLLQTFFRARRALTSAGKRIEAATLQTLMSEHPLVQQCVFQHIE
ncbi:tRNA adenosine(34) deaminase [Gammaproteobacteria bacterium]